MSDTEHSPAGSTADFRAHAGDPTGPRTAADPNGSATPDPLAGLTQSLGELREFAAVYLGARLDRLKLSVRQAVVYAALGVAGGIVGVAMLIAATVMLLQGAALGIAELLGGRLWAGNLIVASVVLLVTVLAIVRVLGKFTIASRQRTIEKYERLRQAERATFGVDVAQRAHGASHAR